MSQGSPYKDLRIEFFRRYYEQAVPYEAYLQTGEPKHRDRWTAYEQQISLTSSQNERIRSFVRRMPILVMSGIWCGDCARQGPMLRAIEKASSKLEFRFIDNRAHPELQDELRINGAEKVPVVVTFSEDFFEFSRFGDRHLSVYLQKVATETGAACDPGFGAPREALVAETEEWVQHFERLHAIVRLSPMLRKRHGD